MYRYESPSIFLKNIKLAEMFWYIITVFKQKPTKKTRNAKIEFKLRYLLNANNTDKK